MKTERFKAVIRGGHKEDAVEVPFDPKERWSIPPQGMRPGRRGFAVSGKLNGLPIASFIVARSRRFWLIVPDDIERAAGVAVGDPVAVEIEPGFPNL